MLRGLLVSVVFVRTTQISTTMASDSASVTHMSTDTERTVRALREIHELWATLLQLAIATWLLEIHLGVGCVGPIAVTIGKTTSALIAVAVDLPSTFSRYCIQSLDGKIEQRPPSEVDYLCAEENQFV